MPSPDAQISDAHVIVVGAGPAGASVAWHLASAGVDVLMLDRATFPRDKVCAEYLSPESSRILSAMGALDAIESMGAARLTGMQVRAPNGMLIRGDFAARHGFSGFRDTGLALRRTVLDALLVQCARAAGARLLEDSYVSDLARDASGHITGVLVRTRDSAVRELRAPIVVGADGLRSVVARRAGLARTARFPRRIALVAHYRGLAGMRSYGEMHVEHDGYVGLADVGHGITNVAMVVPAARAAGLAADRSAFFEQWLAARPHLAHRFVGAERVTPVRATGPFGSAARRAWAPGLALVGDAAEFYDPFTGEGIYTALRSGELAAPFIAEAVASSRSNHTLAAYERARRAEFAGKWRVERLIAAAVAFPALMNHAAKSLSRRGDMADLLVGVAGDFVPAAELLRPGYVFRLLFPASAPACLDV